MIPSMASVVLAVHVLRTFAPKTVFKTMVSQPRYTWAPFNLPDDDADVVTQIDTLFVLAEGAAILFCQLKSEFDYRYGRFNDRPHRKAAVALQVALDIVSAGLPDSTRADIRQYRGRSNSKEFIEGFETVIHTLQTHVRREAARCFKVENGRAGIHRLPREAFVFIVNLAASFSDWGDQEAYAATASPESGLPKLSRFQILGKLRVVGSRWARAIDASPVLWTVFDRQDHAERALALSRNFSISTSEAGVELEDLTVAKKLFECTERWRRISLTMPQTIFPFLRRLHKKKAPRLECLRITLQESDVDAAMVNPFAGDIPNLKILQLQGVALPMAPLPPYFLGLQELRVSEPFIETQALYNLIKDSTELAILEVASTRDSSAAWSPPAIARSESLRLVELHGDLAFRILPYLQTPRCLSMKADIRLDEGLALDARARDTIKHFTRHVISENLDLKVVWEVVGCGHWIDEQTVKLSGSFKHPASYTLAIVVGSAFHRGADWMQLVMDCLSDLSRPVEMALTFDWAGARWDDDCVDSRLLSTLIRLPATTLTFHHKIPHQLLDPLCNPIDDHPAGEASWTFPALEVIHLCREVSTRGMDKMEMLLAERYRHGGPKMLLKETLLP